MCTASVTGDLGNGQIPKDAAYSYLTAGGENINCIKVGNGSVLAPSLAFQGNPQAGFFYDGLGGAIGVATTDGYEQMSISQNGLTLGSTTLSTLQHHSSCHITTLQATPPVVAVDGVAFLAPVLAAGSTDTSGSVTVTTAAVAGPGTITITYNQPFANTPNPVACMFRDPVAANAVGGAVTASTSTGFTFSIFSGGAFIVGQTIGMNYHVIN